MQPTFSTKKQNSQHYAHNVFFKEPISQSPPALLKNGHLYFCPFSASDAISFLDFLPLLISNADFYYKIDIKYISFIIV